MYILRLKKQIAIVLDFRHILHCDPAKPKKLKSFLDIERMIKDNRKSLEKNIHEISNLEDWVYQINSIYLRWNYTFLSHPGDLFKYYIKYLDLIIKYFEEERRRHNTRAMLFGRADDNALIRKLMMPTETAYATYIFNSTSSYTHHGDDF